MKKLVYLKNKFVNLHKAQVSVFDRAFTFGDSIFEVLVAPASRIFDFEGHWQRLQNSSRQTGIPIPFSKQKFKQILIQGLKKIKSKQDIRIRAMISRGEMLDPTLKISKMKPYPVIVFTEFKKITKPLKVLISSVKHQTLSAYNPAKAGNYLNNILAIKEAQQKGFDDAIFVNAKGQVCEGTTSNLFVVKSGKIYTPPLTLGILKGRTREMIFKLCKEFYIPIEEKLFKKDFLMKADEVFLSNTPQGVMPVGHINQKKWVKDLKLTLFLKKALEYQMRLPS